MRRMWGIWAAALIDLLSLTAQASAKDGRANPYKHLVDIGDGRHLNIICSGRGSPTLVFLQGHNADMTSWRKVRDQTAALARTCFYDRAGQGFSDPSSQPMTAENIVGDLHALLRAARIKDHVVLVGHSLGGLFATLYADKFSPDVAGLVLVDPSFDGQFDYTVGADDKKIIRDSNEHWISVLSYCANLARAGALSDSARHDCFLSPPSLTRDESDYMMQQVYRPSYYESLRSEFENFDPVNGRTVDGEQERQAKRTWGNMPLVVLTAGLTFDNATVSPAGKKALKEAWRRGHDQLALRSARGESIIVSDSGHVTLLTKPDAVVAAIRNVVAEARQRP